METSPDEIRRKRRASGASIASSFSLGGCCGYIGKRFPLGLRSHPRREERPSNPAGGTGRDEGKMGAGECDVLEGKWG